MNPNLFRSAEFYRRRYYNPATVLILPLVAFLLFILLFSLFATKEVTVTTVGEVTPTRVIASIQSTSDHLILTNHLAENQAVQQGDLLLQYKATLESSQKDSLSQELERSKRQKAGLETLKASLTDGVSHFTDDEFGYGHTFDQFSQQSKDLELGISKANTEVGNQAAIAGNTVAAINDQISKLEGQVKDYQELYDAIANHSSLSASNPYQSTYNSFQAQYQASPDPAVQDQYLSQVQSSITGLNSSISSLEIQRASTGSPATYDTSLSSRQEALRSQFLQEADKQLTALETQITSLEAQVSQADSQLQQDTLTAPATGILHLNPEIEGKQLFPIGTDLGAIYPDIQQEKAVLITSYLPSQDIANIKKGQLLRLTLEKVGNDALALEGKIKTIDSSATKTKNGNLFKITAQVKLSAETSKRIKYGLEGRAVCILAKKTYFNYYKDKFLHNLE